MVDGAMVEIPNVAIGTNVLRHRGAAAPGVIAVMGDLTGRGVARGGKPKVNVGNNVPQVARMPSTTSWCGDWSAMSSSGMTSNPLLEKFEFPILPG